MTQEEDTTWMEQEQKIAELKAECADLQSKYDDLCKEWDRENKEVKYQQDLNQDLRERLYESEQVLSALEKTSKELLDNLTISIDLPLTTLDCQDSTHLIIAINAMLDQVFFNLSAQDKDRALRYILESYSNNNE